MNNKYSRIILGIDILVLGLLIGLNILNILSFSSFFNGWWTLFIIVPSISYVITAKDKALSIIFLLIGILLLCAANMLIDFSIIWKLIIPIILVGIGLSFVFNFFFENKEKHKNEIDVVFNKDYIKINKKYDGGVINSIFGYLELDLSDSKINKDILMDVTSLFGKVKIILPSDVNLIVKENKLFGSIKNTRKSNKKKSEDTVFITSKCIFGGVSIK